MDQKQICCNSGLICDRLPPLSTNFPWLVAQIFEEDYEEDEEEEVEDEDDEEEEVEHEDEDKDDEEEEVEHVDDEEEVEDEDDDQEEVEDEDEEEEKEKDNGYQIFYTVHDPMSHYRCQIPELLGRYIQGCFHGWVVLSNSGNDKWSLWNPITLKFIHLPLLILKDGDFDDIANCCLSSPPNGPGSILLLTRYRKPKLVFCRLDRKRKRLRWTEMSYSKHLRSITNRKHDFLVEPTCCNGKVYALSNASNSVIEVRIVVKEKKVVISLLPFMDLPDFYTNGRCFHTFLKGSCEELFTICVGFTDITNKKLVDVCLCKLDMTSMVWTEMHELKGMVFFLDVGWAPSVSCSSAIASELGGYIHILHETGKVIYSYDVKDKSISQSCMHCLDLPSRSGDLRTSHISVWAIPESRLQVDDGEAKCKADSKHDEDKEDGMVVRSCKNDEVEFNSKRNEVQQLLNIPFHVLEMIMEFCVGVEYLNFRATCKLCHLAAPVIRWSNEKVRRRLQRYSLGSPWLMAFQKDRGIITFTDPMFGDKYFIKASQELFFDKRILCSSYGWLLLYVGLQRMVFFNPFTNDIHKLPRMPHVDTFCFSAPPTSSDCMVVGYSAIDGTIYLHSVGREPSWREMRLNFGDPYFPSFAFPVFCGRDVYALSKEGGLLVFKSGNLSLETVVAKPPTSCCTTTPADYYLVKCDEHLLLVIVGDFGESVEVFKLKDSTKEWEKMDGLGRHMIYICDVTCLCMDANTPGMENKIYFPRLHSKNGKMVFYSLETCRYHTFSGRNVEENSTDIFETNQQSYAHGWIEPRWS